MRLVDGAVHSHFMRGVGDVAESPQEVRKLSGYIVIQVERRHLGGVDGDLRVDDLLRSARPMAVRSYPCPPTTAAV